VGKYTQFSYLGSAPSGTRQVTTFGSLCVFRGGEPFGMM